MQVRTHRTHGTQEMHRLRQDATPTDQTQGLFLLMPPEAEAKGGTLEWRPDAAEMQGRKRDVRT